MCIISTLFSTSYSIGLYTLKFIKPYGQREAHSQEKCGWRKVMVEMENVPPKCKGNTNFSLNFGGTSCHFHYYFSPPTLFLKMYLPLSIGLYKLE